MTNISRGVDRGNTRLVVLASLMIKMICWGGVFGDHLVLGMSKKTTVSPQYSEVKFTVTSERELSTNLAKTSTECPE